MSLLIDRIRPGSIKTLEDVAAAVRLLCLDGFRDVADYTGSGDLDVTFNFEGDHIEFDDEVAVVVELAGDFHDRELGEKPELTHNERRILEVIRELGLDRVTAIQRLRRADEASVEEV
jgi:hypothetical protein